MLIALNSIILLGIAIWFWKRDQGSLHKFYWPALVAKCLAGIALGIIYSTYYQTSDTFTFFNLAVQRAELAQHDLSAYLNFLFSPEEGYFLGEHRTVFYIKILSVLALITGNNYWLASCYFSLLSFFAAWYLCNTIARIFPQYKISACIAFLFFPSVIFWSAGVIKESLAIAALFFGTAIFLKLWSNEKTSAISILLGILCLWVIFKLKYYYLAVFIPVTMAALVVRWISSLLKISSGRIQIVLWGVILFLGFLAVSFLHPNFSSTKILSVIVSNNTVFMQACTPDDVIHFYKLEPTWLSMIINAPWALVSALFRPFIWEANTIFKFITGLENLLLLAVAISSIPLIRKIPESPHRLLILSAILYCSVLAVFLALSAPNFGTLVRYGVGFLPFVVLLVFQQPFVTKLLSRFF